MKTAISIPDDVFNEVEQVAQKTKASRSELITAAVREYLEKLRAQQLLEDLNKAYAEEETQEEASARKQRKSYYARKIARERQ